MLQLLKIGISVGTLTAKQGVIGLSNSQILPVAAYPGHSRLHPAANTWLPQVLLGLPDGASTPLGSTSWPRRYREVLAALVVCLYSPQPNALMVLEDLLTATPWDTTVDRIQDAHQLAYSKALASGSISGKQQANCSLGTLPNPSGMPRGHGRIKLPEYVDALARHNIYEALAADKGWLSVFDMLGTVGVLEFPPDHTISIGRIMLVNLAPGGYVFDWVTSSMAPVAGWAEAQGSLAAGFANQSLPIWWAQADRWGCGVARVKGALAC